jgi:hypothetical protein
MSPPTETEPTPKGFASEGSSLKTGESIGGYEKLCLEVGNGISASVELMKNKLPIRNSEIKKLRRNIVFIVILPFYRLWPMIYET